VGIFAASIERPEARSVSASGMGGVGVCHPLTMGCPWTLLGALPPDPCYRLVLQALAMLPPQPNPKYTTARH